MTNKWHNTLQGVWQWSKKNWSATLSIIAIVISALAFLSEHSSSASLIEIERAANRLDESLVDNAERQLEVARKKSSFETINALYRDFYQFGDYNTLVIRKLKSEQYIDDIFNLELYLNGFEDLYEQCKTGMISKEQVRINFLHLIGTTCNNAQVEQIVGDGYNGLKLFCYNFYQDSRLAKKAKPENYSCK